MPPESSLHECQNKRKHDVVSKRPKYVESDSDEDEAKAQNQTSSEDECECKRLWLFSFSAPGRHGKCPQASPPPSSPSFFCMFL